MPGFRHKIPIQSAYEICEGVPKNMSTTRSTSLVSRLARSLLLCTAVIYGSTPAFPQITSLSGGRPQGAQPATDMPSSSHQSSKDHQTPSTESTVCGVKHLEQCLKDIGHDQAGIWTSPLRIAPRDAIWLLPFAGATGVALHYDAQAQQELGIDKSRIDTGNTISAFGSPYATFGGATGLYFIGLGTHNEHLAEAGRLGAEAVLDASLVVEALKLATNRERPNEGNGQGGFWPHGTRSYGLNGAFPSGHAAASFALARVIASEYPSRPVQMAAYAFALAISASRVTARQHFPSDVLVGGTFGYLIGGYVVRHHTDENLGAGFSFVPVVDMPTHTFGARIDIRPEQCDFTSIGRFVHRMRPNTRRAKVAAEVGAEALVYRVGD
jgi:hypothetical protein